MYLYIGILIWKQGQACLEKWHDCSWKFQRELGLDVAIYGYATMDISIYPQTCICTLAYIDLKTRVWKGQIGDRFGIGSSTK